MSSLSTRVARIGLSLAILGTAAATPRAAGKLWVVGDTTCPGVDFATIQGAIAAAAPGDVILVRARLKGLVYAPFVLDGKSLTLVGDGRGPIRVGGSSAIRNVQVGQSVTVQGFADLGAMALTNNRGPVWLEDCGFSSSDPTPALAVTDTNSVLLSRCQMTGGPGERGSDGGPGLSVDRSHAQLYEGAVTGGEGREYALIVGRGGDGLVVQAGTVFLSGTAVDGGIGSSGMPIGIGCGLSGGPGGDGLVLATQAAQAYRLDATIRGGAGGPGLGACAQGPAGSQVSGPGTVVSLTGSARSFDTRSPLLEGEPLPLVFRGEPGDVVQLLLSAGQQHLFLPSLHGTVGPGLPGVAATLGVLRESGTLSLGATVPAGTVQPGEAAVVYGQGVFVSTGGVFLGSTSGWVFLDANHDPFDGCSPFVYVDDDDPGDPGPGNPSISNPHENGTAAAPFDAIQEGIDAARLVGRTVLVRDGTYSGPGNENLRFRDFDITVRSENGPASCTIAVTTPGASAFVYPYPPFGSIGVRSQVDGFTVTGGAPAFDMRGDKVEVRNCVVTGNPGGGVWPPGGFFVVGPGTKLIESCIITNNRASEGGGIYCRDSSPIVRNCLIANNRATVGGGGISIDYQTTLHLSGCTFANNSAPRGAAMDFAPTGPSAVADVSNSVFWGNGPNAIAVGAFDALSISYSDVMGGREAITTSGGGTVSWGPGNVNVNPLFVQPAAGDYHLQPLSPCIDAGDPSYVPQPGETDIDGQARLSGAAVDMGADER